MPKSPEELLSLSKNWSEMPPKPSKTSRQSIEILEPAIRQLIEKGYTLAEICLKIKEDFEIKITSGTLSSYLSQFEAERKKSLMAQKRATRLSKANSQLNTDNNKVLEAEAIALSISKNDNVSEDIELPKVKETVKSSSDNSSSAIESVVPKSVKSSKIKTASVESNSVIIDNEAINLERERLKNERAEAEKRHEEKMDKHFNKY